MLVTDPRITAVVDVMIAAARRVRSSPRAQTTRFALGGEVVELVSRKHVNAAGIPIDQAFVPTGTSTPSSLSLTAIDDSDAGYPPPFDWPSEWNEPFGVVQEHHTLPCRFAMDIHTRSFSVWNPASGEAVVWFRDIETIPYWAAATPFRLQLSWIADSLDAELIHGAAVVVDGRAVLLIGPSGAGKSTLALAAVRAGLPILGDDYLLLRREGVQALYRRAKAHQATVSALGPIPGVEVLNTGEVSGKVILDLNLSTLDSRLVPIALILAPTFGARPEIHKLSAAAIGRRLVVPSIEGLLGGTSGTVVRMARLLRATASAELVVGPDPDANLAVLAEAVLSLSPVGAQ